MMQNNPQDAIGSLDEAVKLGFKDLERVRSQKEFQSLLNDEKFNEVLAKIDAEKG
jgi:hypothetical protein